MDDGRWTMDDGRWTMDDGRKYITIADLSSILFQMNKKIKTHGATLGGMGKYYRHLNFNNINFIGIRIPNSNCRFSGNPAATFSWIHN